MKPLRISLTTKGSIQKAIDELNKYKESLNEKSAVFVSRLAELGIPIIDQRIAQAQGDSDPNHYTYITVNSFGSYSEARLVVEGRDILFFEFGAGVHYNGAAYTSDRISSDGFMNGAEYHITGGEELGYTIGSYGDGHGVNDFWFYTAETGESIMSHGTEATMPLHAATVEILTNIQQIAKEVFRG